MTIFDKKSKNIISFLRYFEEIQGDGGMCRREDDFLKCKSAIADLQELLSRRENSPIITCFWSQDVERVFSREIRKARREIKEIINRCVCLGPEIIPLVIKGLFSPTTRGASMCILNGFEDMAFQDILEECEVEVDQNRRKILLKALAVTGDLRALKYFRKNWSRDLSMRETILASIRTLSKVSGKKLTLRTVV